MEILPLHHNSELIEAFYTAFQARDAATMAAAYHLDATFTDPVFRLRGTEVGDMWRMFCARGDDLEVEFSDVTADDERGSARWEARYTYSPTGRPVHNRIVASFLFDEGRIAEHRDDFDLAAWAKQALGLSGLLLGRTNFMQSRIRAQAATQLARYRRRAG
jgi:ketosteroid isomerase-like protein